MTFTDQARVFLGGKEVRAHYFGRGHTNGDAIVYFPELGAIHTGDLFLASGGGGRGAAPARPRPPGVPIYVDYAQGGSFLDWTTTLDRDAEAGLRHGDPRPRPGVDASRSGEVQADLETMRTRLAGLIKRARHEASS